MNVFDMPFSKVYACLVQKAERKGRTKDEVDRIITWLTGYPTVEAISNVSYGAFIDGAPEWNPRAEGVRHSGGDHRRPAHEETAPTGQAGG